MKPKAALNWAREGVVSIFFLFINPSTPHVLNWRLNL